MAASVRPDIPGAKSNRNACACGRKNVRPKNKGMAQQQLVDYIKAQLKVGVGKEEMRRTLLDAGWVGTDVDDALRSAVGRDAVSSNNSSKTAADGKPIVVSDLIPSTSEMEIVTAEPVSVGEKSAESTNPKTRFNMPSIKLSKFDLKITVIVALAAVAVGFGVAAAYFYWQTNSLSDKLIVLTGAGEAAKSQVEDLSNRVSDLTKVRDDLTKTNNDLINAKEELEENLSFFAVPEGLSASSEAAVTFSGVVGGGGKSAYSLMATSGIKILIANSKDANVDAALKALLGQTAQISGTHVPGSQNVTITAVNGASVQ